MRGKGEGSVFKDTRTGLWTAVIELPPLNGKRRRKTIRRKTKGALLDAMRQAQKDLRDRGDLPTVDQTVAQFFTYWLREHVEREKRPNTVDGYRNVVQQYVIPTIGNIKLSKVTGEHVARVTKGMIALGRSSTTAMTAHRIMVVAFNQALAERRIGTNPAKETKAPRKAVVKLEALTAEEGIKVLETVANDVNGARWAMALLTGARRGEVLGLEVERVTDVIDLSWQMQRLPTGARGTKGEIGKPIVPADFEYRHVLGGLYLTRPKSRAGQRVIPLVEPLKSILERHIGERTTGLVFTNEGAPIDPGQDSKDWRVVLARTGIQKDVRLHDLRHTAVDLLYSAGVPEDIIMRIVGHSTRMTTRGYQSAVRDDPRMIQAMERFSALLDASSQDTPRAIGA